MEKLKYLIKEISYLIRQNKYYFLAPVLFLSLLLVFLVFHVGPNVVIAFIYAGV